MVILNDGCSHSAKSVTDEEINYHGSRTSYCDFLPGQIYNIAKPGTGIDSSRVEKFIKKTELDSLNNELTHFIFQIPSPSRQTLYLNLTDEKFFEAPMNYWTDKAGRDLRGFMKKKREVLPEVDFGCSVDHKTKSALRVVSVVELEPDDYNKHFFKFTYDNFSWTHIKDNFCIPATLWSTLRAHTAISINSFIMDIFKSEDKYFKKAINEVDRAVRLVKEQWPNIKIIFLRYEESGMPLIYEFCKPFYKKDLSDYCNKNDITYINEKNFNTEWFRLNNLTNDTRHPNDEGAKLIAEKIKQFL